MDSKLPHAMVLDSVTSIYIYIAFNSAAIVVGWRNPRANPLVICGYQVCFVAPVPIARY